MLLTMKAILIALSLSSGPSAALHMVHSLNTTVQAPNGDYVVTYRNAGTIKARPCRGDIPHVFTRDEGYSLPDVVGKRL